MKTSMYILSLLLTCITISSYAQATTPKSVNTPTATDKKAIRDLLVKTYKWQEANTSVVDFEPVLDKKEERYIGLDYKIHQKRMTALQNTGFFSAEFLQNYDAIAKGIDTRLKTKKMNGWLEICLHLVRMQILGADVRITLAIILGIKLF
jgi:hypothetical protein